MKTNKVLRIFALAKCIILLGLFFAQAMQPGPVSAHDGCDHQSSGNISEGHGHKTPEPTDDGPCPTETSESTATTQATSTTEASPTIEASPTTAASPTVEATATKTPNPIVWDFKLDHGVDCKQPWHRIQNRNPVDVSVYGQIFAGDNLISEVPDAYRILYSWGGDETKGWGGPEGDIEKDGSISTTFVGYITGWVKATYNGVDVYPKNSFSVYIDCRPAHPTETPSKTVQPTITNTPTATKTATITSTPSNTPTGTLQASSTPTKTLVATSTFPPVRATQESPSGAGDETKPVNIGLVFLIIVLIILFILAVVWYVHFRGKMKGKR